MARRIANRSRARTLLGAPGTLSSRLQPNHPTDDARGIAASILDGLMYGCGDAVIGINPATDSIGQVTTLVEMLDGIINRYEIPTQSCILTHVTTTIEAINRINREHHEEVGDPEILTRIAQYELAFKMQSSVPDLTDMSKEPKSVLESYGAQPGDGSFASNCLLARRLAR